jgi:hypothetical protein
MDTEFLRIRTVCLAVVNQCIPGSSLQGAKPIIVAVEFSPVTARVPKITPTFPVEGPKLAL